MKNSIAKRLLFWAILLGGVAVLLGAFGAHGLRNALNESRLEAFKTGVFYQFIHVFALILAAWLLEHSSNRAFFWAGVCFLFGIFCFSRQNSRSRLGFRRASLCEGNKLRFAFGL